VEGAAKAAMDKGRRHARKAREKVIDRLHLGSAQSASNSSDKSASIVGCMKQCHHAAKQTVELCASTLATGQSLVSCGNQINRSLVGAATDLSAESFAVIADLIDGDKTKEARDLALKMKGQSAECISLSIQMVDSLERSVEALPSLVESYVEKKARKSVTDELTEEERALAAGIDEDEEELTRCIDAIENLKLLTAVEAGTRSFEAIKTKSQLCHRIFEIIKKYAADILGITEAVSSRDASTIIAKVKDGSMVKSILKSIGLSKYIKRFAEGCKRVMDKIVKLFEGAAGKLSMLWGALAHAKDIMVSSLKEVAAARSLCGDAGERADELKRATRSIGNVENLTRSPRSMDRSVGDAMGTARAMDEGIAEAMSRMRDAARKVGDVYCDLPSIVTEGITEDTDDEVAESFGAKIRDVDVDVRELEAATRAIEESNVIHGALSIHREMSNLPRKVDACSDMIDSCATLADWAGSSINSFLGRWTLETALEHMKEMCRLVSLSRLMEELADRIHRLVKAITTLLRAMSSKVGSFADSVQSSGLDSVVGAGLNSVIGKVFGK